MALKAFLCDQLKWVDGDSNYQTCYITHNYAVGPHVRVRINSKSYIVFIDDKTVPLDLYSNPNVTEIAWESEKEIGTPLSDEILLKTGIDESKLQSVNTRQVIEKMIHRKFTGYTFDINMIKQKIENGKSVYIGIREKDMNFG